MKKPRPTRRLRPLLAVLVVCILDGATAPVQAAEVDSPPPTTSSTENIGDLDAPSPSATPDTGASAPEESSPSRAAEKILRFSIPNDSRESLSQRERRFFKSGHEWLEERGILGSVDIALMNQYANRTNYGGNNAATFAWQIFVDYELLNWKDVGSFHIGGTVLGSVGMDYNEAQESLSERTGSISILNGNVFPHGVALDQLYLQYLDPSASFFVSVGKIDMSDFFDNNRVANNSFRKFFAFTFENSLSIPFPTYGDVGILARWDIRENVYVMFGAGIAESDVRVPVWGGLDGAWWELLESGITIRPDFLGAGTYRLTIWQSNVDSRHGFGASFSIAQALGRDWLLGFLRLGVGNPNQTTIKSAISGGFAIQKPFGRALDETGIAFSWADSVESLRNEKLLEVYYRFSINGALSMSPDLQVLIDPALGPSNGVSIIAGVRMFASF